MIRLFVVHPEAGGTTQQIVTIGGVNVRTTSSLEHLQEP